MPWYDPTSWFSGPTPGQTPVSGVGIIGTKPEQVSQSYAGRVTNVLGGTAASREEEERQRKEQEGLIRQMGAPSYAATQEAQAQARQAAEATLGAAAGARGAAGIQTAALGALGAGTAQQYGMQAAAQVQAAEAQRNALAQAQMAEMLRQQQIQAAGLQEGDYAQMLAAQRALLGQQTSVQTAAAAAEEERQRRMQAGFMGAFGAGIAAIPNAKKPPPVGTGGV